MTFLFTLSMLNAMSRYVPELLSLCAREIANRCRAMTKEERYNYLQSVPKHLVVFIKGFPLDVVGWCFNGGLTSAKRIKSFVKLSPDTIRETFTDDCLYGSSYHLIPRKCSNVYCDDSSFGRMILTDLYFIRYRLCNTCKSNALNLACWIRLKNSIRTI